jgi:hypothetical protein
MGKTEGHTKLEPGNIRGRSSLEDTEVDGRIISELILQK